MPSHRQHAVVKAEQSLHNQENILPQSQLILTLAVLSITLFISFIDQNGISTTLPTIASDLGAQNTISWAGTSSLIANTTFQMLYGRLSDIFGRKTVYLTAIASLCLADLLCGLSQNPAMFYVFRGLAGVGGGGITNLAMIIISDVVTLEKRGKYQGVYGGMVGLANVVGPFLAAALASKTTWRAFFWMLAPLSAITGVLSYFYLPGKPPTADLKHSIRKVDYLGSFLSSVAVIFILIPVSGGGAYFDWNSPLVISFFVIGGLSLILFVIVEWKVAKLPMMPVDIYSNPMVVLLLAQSFLLGLVYQNFLYYVPIYLQNAHGYDPIMSALLLLPMVGTQSFASILAGLYITHFQRYLEVIFFGFGIWTLGAGLTLLYGRHTHPGVIFVPLFLIGIGVGCIFQPTLVVLQAHSPKRRRAVIISNRNFFRCSGGAVGLAVSAAVLQARLRSALPARYIYLAASTYSVPKGLPDEVLDAYMAASHAVFLLQVPLIGLCLLGTFFIRDRGLQSKEDSEEEKQTQAQVQEQEQSEPGVAQDIETSQSEPPSHVREKEADDGGRRQEDDPGR